MKPAGVERAPAPPAVAVRLFGDRLPLARAYADWLAGPGVERGLIGPREAERLWDRHLLNCAVVGELVPHGVTVADVGSGAGLPGLVLALARPDLTVQLVEPLLRRSESLREVVAELGLDRVEVIRARAEELPAAGSEVVTARAVAPLGRLLGWTLPLLRPGGELLALKGVGAHEELAEVAALLATRAVRSAKVEQAGVGVIDPPTTVVHVVKGG